MKHRRPDPRQPALFEMREDARPLGERSAAERYAEPSLIAWLDDDTNKEEDAT